MSIGDTIASFLGKLASSGRWFMGRQAGGIKGDHNVQVGRDFAQNVYTSPPEAQRGPVTALEGGRPAWFRVRPEPDPITLTFVEMRLVNNGSVLTTITHTELAIEAPGGRRETMRILGGNDRYEFPSTNGAQQVFVETLPGSERVAKTTTPVALPPGQIVKCHMFAIVDAAIHQDGDDTHLHLTCTDIDGQTVHWITEARDGS